jgi:hypothetical protein
MADTKRGREEQAAHEDCRQRELEMARALASAREPEAADVEPEEVDWPPECHRRDCHELAAFRVLERYDEETGHGTVEADALLCPAHTDEEGPSNLENAGEDYLFQIEPLPETPA